MPISSHLRFDWDLTCIRSTWPNAKAVHFAWHLLPGSKDAHIVRTITEYIPVYPTSIGRARVVEVRWEVVLFIVNVLRSTASAQSTKRTYQRDCLPRK